MEAISTLVEVMGPIVATGRSGQVQDLVDPGLVSQKITVEEFIDGPLQGVSMRDTEQLADTLLRVERDSSFIGHNGQEDIEQGFGMAQAFQTLGP